MKKYISPNLVLWLVVIASWMILVSGLMQPFEPKDDSDFPDRSSGMNVLTDHLTGCQYLSRGSITPRLDATGKQICKKV